MAFAQQIHHIKYNSQRMRAREKARSSRLRRRHEKHAIRLGKRSAVASYAKMVGLYLVVVNFEFHRDIMLSLKHDRPRRSLSQLHIAFNSRRRTKTLGQYRGMAQQNSGLRREGYRSGRGNGRAQRGGTYSGHGGEVYERYLFRRRKCVRRAIDGVREKDRTGE